MCGLTGFYALKGLEASISAPKSSQSSSAHANMSKAAYHALGKAMNDTLVHRGPDHGDIWQDPDHALVLAHRRLSILDLSEHGHQPMMSEAGRYVIIFNGEIYNHQDLRKTYLQGETFRGHSDTETLLALFTKLGVEQSLQHINGMFAIVVWDRKEAALYFARDRFGKKPLYIGWAGNTLVFGSEIKALCAYPDFQRRIDKKALALYTRYNAVPAPMTIYQGLWQLQPGHFLRVEVSALTGGKDLAQAMTPFWSAQAAIKEPLEHVEDITRGATEDTLIAQCETLLTQSVRDRMLSDVPLGAFLSGGIDSSTVVALMQKNAEKRVHTYTIGFDNPGYDEAKNAREVAQHLGTDHHEHYCSARDALDIIPKLPDMYDEPFADQSAIPTYLVSHFARKEVTVALSGDGGDEMFAGYSRHVVAPKVLNYAQKLPGFMTHACANALKAMPAHLIKTLQPRKPLLQKHLHKISDLLSAQTPEDVYDILLRCWQETPVLSEQDMKLGTPNDWPPVLSPVQDMLLRDTLFYLTSDILTKVDRTSMATSLEVRAPLLDQRIFAFAWSLPPDLKIRDGKGKYILRQVLRRHVPEHMFERPKKGFGVPIGQWLRHELREWAEDLLDQKTLKEQGLLNADAVREIWSAHQNGEGQHTDALWNVLMFQAWHRRWISKN